MSSAAATDIGNYVGSNSGPHTTSPIPPDRSPQRFLDWRLREAYQLAQEADTEPPSHEDPWIEEAAHLIHAGFLGNRKYRPSPLR